MNFDKEYAYDFLNFLLKFKQSNENVFNYNIDEKLIHSSEFFRYSSFKALICELFNNAINSIPSIITEYTIICTNNKGISKLIIGVFDDIDDEGEISVAKIISSNNKYIMNKLCVNNMYIANKTHFHNHYIVDLLISLLYMNGYEPSIKTESKINTKLTLNTKKN